MTTQITVIGLNQVGASISLALAEHKDHFKRHGHDADDKKMKKYEKEGVFDRTFTRLGESVRGSDIVILSLPIDLIKDALSLISKELKPGAVVIDTSIISQGITDWARETLPKEAHFISVKPVINPAYLEEIHEDQENGHADLFEKGEFIIASGYGTDQKALQTATELAQLLKTKPMFTDPLEADSMIAGVEQLPMLTAAALVYSLAMNPGWQDSRKATSKAFFRAASNNQLSSEQEFFGMNLILNKDSVTQKLEQYITTLIDLRDMIKESDEKGLTGFMKEARNEFDTWLMQRNTAEWDVERHEDIPARGERWFGSILKPKNKK